MPYRFIHAADIHLDSPLLSLALRSPELAELIGNSTRRAFVNVVDLCLAEGVDGLILAGDLYDGEQTSMKTARFLAEQIRRLDEAGIKVFIIRGNHDALSKITKELTFPEGVKVFGGRADTVTFDHAGGLAIAIHGLSFAQPHAPESLLGKYKPPVAGAVNIGLMHTSLGGALGHDPYAPCSIAELGASGFRYWALGHIHKRAVTDRNCVVVMPGMPQGRDIGEAGAKSVTLVTINDDQSIRLEERLTSVAQFERVDVSLNGITDWREMIAAISSALEIHRDAALSEHLVARLSVSGATPLAWRMRRDPDLLKAEADDRASVIGRTWIEKIEVHCTGAAPTSSGATDPLIDLQELIAKDIIPAAAYEAAITQIAEELRPQLPPECRRLFGSDEKMFKAVLAALAAEGTEDVLARLRPHSGSGEA